MTQIILKSGNRDLQLAGKANYRFHVYTTIRYVDTVNGSDLNNGQYDTPYKTVDRGLVERMLPANLSVAFQIVILNAAGDLGTLDFDGTGIGFVGTWIIGVGSINITAGTWYSTVNLTNCGYYFYMKNCPPLDINLFQTASNWTRLTIQGGTPSGSITRSGNQNNIQIFLYNCSYSLYSSFTSIMNVMFGATLKLRAGSGYFTRVNLYDGGIIEVYDTVTFSVDWASFYGGVLKLRDGSAATIANNELSIFATKVIKHPNSTLTLQNGPIDLSKQASKYIGFEPGASGITATNVEAAIIEVKTGGLGSPYRTDEDLVAAVTTADGQTSGAALSATPKTFRHTFVNGRKASVGDAVKTKDGYFSRDAGATALAISALASGDIYYWNGSIAGFQLDTTFRITFDYFT